MTGPTPAPTAPAKTEEKGNALQKFIGDLPPAMQVAIKMEMLLARTHAAVIAETDWGEKARPETRQRVAQYLAKHGLDVGEIDVLGGKIYRNHQFYLNRLAKLQTAGDVDYALYDHIGHDPRLDEWAKDTADPENAKWAADERARRRRERIIHSIADDALAAVVFRLKLKGADREITGAKAVYKSDKDPVGNKFPGVTAESRAARRCLKNAIPSLPEAEQKWMHAVDADFQVISSDLKAELGDEERTDADRPRLAAVTPVKQGGYDEPKPRAGSAPSPAAAPPPPEREPGEEDDDLPF